MQDISIHICMNASYNHLSETISESQRLKKNKTNMLKMPTIGHVLCWLLKLIFKAKNIKAKY